MPPLVLVVVAWIAGLLAAHHLLVPVGVEPGSLILLGIIPLAGTILWYRDREMALSGVCALAFLGGAVRYQAQMPDLQDPRFLAHFNDRGWVTVEGVVRGYPDMRATWTDLELHAELVEVAGQSHRTHGKVLVKAPRYPEYRYGDRLRVSGFLLTPPELDGFSYRKYLANRDIYALVEGPQIEKVASNEGHLLWGGLFALKDRARDSIARLMPNSEASLLQGILLGIRSGIPKELYDDYNATGASHVIVISGAKTPLSQTALPHCRQRRPLS